MERARVIATYGDGVESVAAIARTLSSRQWAMPACGRWTATETARHVLSVIDWYHEWLDRAVAGESTPPFRASEIDARTAAALLDYSDLDGTVAVEMFCERAAQYVERVESAWDLPYSFPFGDITAGLHVGIAAAEWHLHAWDLSAAAPSRHAPADPEGLFLATGFGFAAAEPRVKRAVMSRLVPVAAKRSPWQQMLKRSGREV